MTRTNNPAHARGGTSPRKLEIGVLYGFRALMVLAVVNYHIWQQSWLSQRVSLLGLSTDFDFFTRSSYLFVDGMILLSGFLLYLPYARQTLEGTPVPENRAVLPQPPFAHCAQLPGGRAAGAGMFRIAPGGLRYLRRHGQGCCGAPYVHLPVLAGNVPLYAP